MLSHTFLHLPGIGKTTEERLWHAGIHHWDQWEQETSVRLPNSSRPELTRLLERSVEELDRGPDFFSRLLPAGEQWRLFSHFREHTAYLDIETTGLGPRAEVTTVSLYDGNRVRWYINGENLEELEHDLAECLSLIHI